MIHSRYTLMLFSIQKFVTKATICCTHFFPFLFIIQPFFMFVKEKNWEPQVHVKKDPFPWYVCKKIIKIKIAYIYKLTAWRKDNHYNNILLEDSYAHTSIHCHDDVFCPIKVNECTQERHLCHHSVTFKYLFGINYEAS